MTETLIAITKIGHVMHPFATSAERVLEFGKTAVAVDVGTPASSPP